MNQSLPGKLNEAYSIAIRFIVPPSFIEFKTLMLETLIVNNKDEEFEKAMELGLEDGLITAIITELNEKLIGVLMQYPKFDNQPYLNLIHSIHMKAMDYLIKNTAGEPSITVKALENAEEQIKDMLFIANIAPENEVTKKYLKVIDKNKKRILETPDITIPNQDLEEPYYWPYEPEKLTLLIEDLKTHKFIEQPENNISSFDKKDDPDRIKIKWIGTIQRNLFFLLFAIYDENEVFKKEKITDIALKLFDFKYTTEYNLGKNYNKVRSDFLSSEYVSKKQSLLKSIVRKLDLPPLKQAPTA